MQTREMKREYEVAVLDPAGNVTAIVLSDVPAAERARIAARLLRCIRSRDYAFRIGGDEFALIVSADMDEEQRARMTERIQTTLSAPVVLDGKELSVGVSCGCACYPEDGDASQVRITADSRMYETKQRHHENDRTEGES